MISCSLWHFSPLMSFDELQARRARYHWKSGCLRESWRAGAFEQRKTLSSSVGNVQKSEEWSWSFWVALPADCESKPYGESFVRAHSLISASQGRWANMNAQSSGQSQRIAGLVLLLIGLFIAVFYAVQCRYDVASRQLSDLTFVVLGVSLQLLGLGLIVWKNK